MKRKRAEEEPSTTYPRTLSIRGCRTRYQIFSPRPEKFPSRSFRPPNAGSFRRRAVLFPERSRVELGMTCLRLEFSGTAASTLDSHRTIASYIRPLNTTHDGRDASSPPSPARSEQKRTIGGKWASSHQLVSNMRLPHRPHLSPAAVKDCGRYRTTVKRSVSTRPSAWRRRK